MGKAYQIIVVNPGSTSTKVGVYQNEERRFYTNIEHSAKELGAFADIPDQLPFRRDAITQALEEAGVDLAKTDAFSAICTGMPPMGGGVYEVNDRMAADAAKMLGSRHPGNLGPILAKDLADKYGARGFVVEPSSTDEFCLQARLTGFRGLLRTSRGHPLNQRAVAMRYAKDIGRRYDELNLVVVHMGGGISVSAHERGKMVDTADSTRGEGRMAPTRTGALPAAAVVELCFSGEYTKRELLDKIQKTGGWVDLLGTSSALEVEERIANGDRWAKYVYDTTIYQIGKDIGAYAAVLHGQVDGVLLTGGLAHSQYLIDGIRDMIGFIGPVRVYPGEYEMEALAAGALRVLRGEDIPQSYTGEPVFPGFEAVGLTQ